jgi:hypothetical protein
MLIVLLVATATVALYGRGYCQVPRDTNEHQDARVPIKKGPSWEEIDDPAKDGWDTEVFASQATKQLKTLGNLLTHPRGIDAPAVAI